MNGASKWPCGRWQNAWPFSPSTCSIHALYVYWGGRKGDRRVRHWRHISSVPVECKLLKDRLSTFITSVTSGARQCLEYSKHQLTLESPMVWADLLITCKIDHWGVMYVPMLSAHVMLNTCSLPGSRIEADLRCSVQWRELDILANVLCPHNQGTGADFTKPPNVPG